MYSYCVFGHCPSFYFLFKTFRKLDSISVFRQKPTQLGLIVLIPTSGHQQQHRVKYTYIN
jgi:hypothetical protein